MRSKRIELLIIGETNQYLNVQTTTSPQQSEVQYQGRLSERVRKDCTWKEYKFLVCSKSMHLLCERILLVAPDKLLYQKLATYLKLIVSRFDVA